MEGLLPTLKELQGTVNSVRNDINRFNKTVNNLTEKVSNLEEHHDQLSSKMDQLESKLNSIKFKAVESQLEEHMNQTTSELAGLQRNTTSEIATLQTSLQSNTQQLTTKLDTLDSKVDSVNRAMESQLEEHKNQATSELAGLQNMFNMSLVSHTEQLSHLNCKMDILDASMRDNLGNIKEDLSSLNEKMNRINAHVMEHDNYVTTELMNLDQNLEQKFTLLKNSLGYTYPIHTCGGTGGWRRVVYLDMTDPNTTCPSGWRLTSHSKRTCGRVSTGHRTCDSITFSVSGGDYTRVCGRIKGYQYLYTDAFEAYHDGHVTTIDGAYVSGVSLTHGSPRQHIWTFAAGYSEFYTTKNDACPCDAPVNITIPPFVGGDYSANQDGTHGLIQISFQMILSGMVMAVLPAVHVAHSTILHISLNNSPALPLMI